MLPFQPKYRLGHPEIIYFYYPKKKYRIKVSKKQIILFWKKLHWKVDTRWRCTRDWLTMIIIGNIPEAICRLWLAFADASEWWLLPSIDRPYAESDIGLPKEFGVRFAGERLAALACREVLGDCPMERLLLSSAWRFFKRTLDGFRSPWMMLLEWMYFIPSATSSRQSTHCACAQTLADTFFW